jgi:hypothetical protein
VINSAENGYNENFEEEKEYQEMTPFGWFIESGKNAFIVKVKGNMPKILYLKSHE